MIAGFLPPDRGEVSIDDVHIVRQLIQSMAPEKAIIISPHILEEVDAICSRAAIIDHGRLLAIAPGHRVRVGLRAWRNR